MKGVMKLRQKYFIYSPVRKSWTEVSHKIEKSAVQPKPLEVHTEMRYHLKALTQSFQNL